MFQESCQPFEVARVGIHIKHIPLTVDEFVCREGLYDNTVSIMVEEGQSLTFGLRKAVTIGGDWCMFDDFQLFYLGTETPSSIVATETNAQQPATYYNISGVRLNAPQKGINIVKVGDKVKKVLVK